MNGRCLLEYTLLDDDAGLFGVTPLVTFDRHFLGGKLKRVFVDCWEVVDWQRVLCARIMHYCHRFRFVQRRTVAEMRSF